MLSVPRFARQIPAGQADMPLPNRPGRPPIRPTVDHFDVPRISHRMTAVRRDPPDRTPQATSRTPHVAESVCRADPGRTPSARTCPRVNIRRPLHASRLTHKRRTHDAKRNNAYCYFTKEKPVRSSRQFADGRDPMPLPRSPLRLGSWRDTSRFRHALRETGGGHPACHVIRRPAGRSNACRKTWVPLYYPRCDAILRKNMSRR